MFLLGAILAISLVTVQGQRGSSSATVSPDFLDLHYLPQQNCKCSEPEPCSPVYVSLKRERATLVKGGGGSGANVVELIREQIREVPSHSVVYAETEVIEIQKVPEPLFVNVTLERETFEEEIEYYDVVVPKVEINYIYRDVHVYAEVQEPVAIPNVRKQDLPVHVTHRPVQFNETTFAVDLRQEFLVQEPGDPISVTEVIEYLEPHPFRKESTIQCESLVYVPVPCYPPGQRIPGQHK